jgi:GTP pyrophosphokinase
MPPAHRLGLYNIKTQLEDLGLKYTETPIYNDIVSKKKRDQRPTGCLYKRYI